MNIEVVILEFRRAKQMPAELTVIFGRYYQAKVKMHHHLQLT